MVAAGAAKQAVTAADVLDNVDPTRFGVYLGSGGGQQNFEAFTEMVLAAIGEDDQLDVAAFVKTGMEVLNPVAELEQEPNMPAGHLASMFDAQGPKHGEPMCHFPESVKPMALYNEHELLVAVWARRD